MIGPQIPFQAPLLPALASWSLTTHSRHFLPENVSSLETMHVQSALGFSSAFFIFFLPQILFLHFPSYIYSYLSPFQTPRPGLDTPPLYNCPNHLLIHTPINKDSVCLFSVSTTPNIALLQHLQCHVLTIHLPICSSD